MSIAAAPRKEIRPVQPIPPLQAGDRLTRAEFEHRYRAMPHVHKAELIEGVVPGLWLDAAALLAGDLARAIQVVQQGLASPEHAEFVSRLQQATSQTCSEPSRGTEPCAGTAPRAKM